MLVRGIIGGIILMVVVLIATILIVGRGPGKVEISYIEESVDSAAKKMTISFKTTKKVLGEVMVGLKASDYRDSYYQDPESARKKRKEHEITIEKLAPSTTYHYQALARDDAGKILANSPDATFTLEEKVEPPVEPEKPKEEKIISDAEIRRAVEEALREVRK